MSSSLDIESLFRMLMSPSEAPQLEGTQVLLSAFAPHHPPQVVDLSAAPLEVSAQERVELNGHPSDEQTPDKPSALLEGAQSEGESYLAFLDQVQSRETSSQRGPHEKSKRRRGLGSQKTGRTRDVTRPSARSQAPQRALGEGPSEAQP